MERTARSGQRRLSTAAPARPRRRSARALRRTGCPTTRGWLGGRSREPRAATGNGVHAASGGGADSDDAPAVAGL